VGEQPVKLTVDSEAAAVKDEAGAIETDVILPWDKATEIEYIVRYRDASGMQYAPGKVTYPGDNKGMRVEVPKPGKLD
jgi:hypothetical protein